MLHITSYYLYFVAAKPYSLVSTTTNGWFQFGIKNEASLCTLYILVTVLYSVDYSMDWLGDLQEPPIVHGNNHGFQLQKAPWLTSRQAAQDQDGSARRPGKITAAKHGAVRRYGKV